MHATLLYSSTPSRAIPGFTICGLQLTVGSYLPFIVMLCHPLLLHLLSCSYVLVQMYWFCRKRWWAWFITKCVCDPHAVSAVENFFAHALHALIQPLPISKFLDLPLGRECNLVSWTRPLPPPQLWLHSYQTIVLACFQLVSHYRIGRLSYTKCWLSTVTPL